MAKIIGIVLGAALFVFGAGYRIGHDSAPVEIETKIIRLPPKTKVIEKTKTEYVNRELPASCYAGFELIDNGDKYISELGKRSGNVRSGLDNLTKEVYKDSVPAVNELVAFIIKQGGALETAAVDLAGANVNLKEQAEACQMELQ